MSETNNKGLLSCRCTYCGAPIEISPDVEVVTCEYCDTSFRVEKATKEEVIINNIQNINIEKKGFGQAAIEFLDRRAEAYERAAAEERARQAEREARKRKILLTIGKVFLWIYFFPIMLTIYIVKKRKEEREKLQYNSNNSLDLDEPIVRRNPVSLKQPVYEERASIVLWIFLIAIVLIFTLAIWLVIDTDPNISISSTPFSNPTMAPTASPDVKWYDREPIQIGDGSFTEETVSETSDVFRYVIPKAWRVAENNGWKYYYPFEDTNRTSINVAVETLKDYDENYFDNLSTNDQKEILDNYLKSIINTGMVNNYTAYPCDVRGMRGVYIVGDYVNQDLGVEGKIHITTVFAKNKYIMFCAMMADDKHNIEINDYCAVLRSLEIVS